jgi:rubrerythrin
MIKYSADDVFEMAVRSEHNAAAYYRKAAQLHRDQSETEFLVKLAEMEDEHERTFRSLRSELTARERMPTALDPYDQNSLYLSSMANKHIAEGTPTLADTLTGQETMTEILTAACDLEKESILFYVGMKDMVPEDLGKQRIERIIEEEKSHFVTLTEELSNLK